MSLDKQNPILLLDTIFEPESPYWEAVRLEKMLEERIMKRQVDIADASFRIKKIKRVICVEVFDQKSGDERDTAAVVVAASTTTAATTNTTADPQAPEEAETPSEQPTNTLCIDIGYMEPEDGTIIKSPPAYTYIKSIIVEGSDGQILYDIPKTNLSKDCLELTIPAQTDTVKVAVVMDPQPVQFKLSEELRELLGTLTAASTSATSKPVQTASRPQVIMFLWQYIKLNRLQESEEKKIIKLDERMKQCFSGALAQQPERTSITFADLPVLIQGHLIPLDPIVIEHRVKSCLPSSPGEQQQQQQPQQQPGNPGEDQQGPTSSFQFELEVEDAPRFPR